MEARLEAYQPRTHGSDKMPDHIEIFDHFMLAL
jgi:hypothetical protein